MTPSRRSADDSSAHGRSILPLPEHVVAQIKSSTAITSLTGVVLELLKNSLDARAAKIEASVDFARGACTVEDNGLGIAPPEFREDGGLGKLYCTSKHEPREALLGRNGTFLASLASVSLLSLTSHHHQHRSHSTLTIHHAQAIERQLPAPPHAEIHGKHGTRVAVRNLFGNLPVRVKQRSRVLEHRADSDRLWESLRSGVTGLLLSWAGSVSLKVRDSDNRVVFSFSTSETPRLPHRDSAEPPKMPSAHLGAMLTVLTQAKYISMGEWSSWIPVSASTPVLSVKGAISLDPAPNKNAQFISLGVRPLSAELEHNELYDHINRSFAISSFGTVEDSAGKAQLSKVRQQSDTGLNADGHSNQQSTARKGVDRYPMFHLRIVLRGALGSAVHQDQFVHDEANVQSILDVLGAMTTQWLSAHHFRPVQPRRKRHQPSGPPTPLQDRSGLSSPTHDPQLVRPHLTCANSPSGPGGAREAGNFVAGAQPRGRQSVIAQGAPPERSKYRALAEWTRIKSGKASFYQDATKFPRIDRSLRNGLPSHLHVPTTGTPSHERPHSAAVFQPEPLARGALNLQAPQPLGDTPAITDDGSGDATILWTDPLTKKTHLLNGRTGCVVPHASPWPATEPAMPLSNHSRTGSTRSLQLPPTASAEETPWLDGILRAWANPIFSASEKRIQQVNLEEDPMDQNSRHKHPCSHSAFEDSFQSPQLTGSNRLSRQDLLNAEVIAQVDKKFVLVRMPSNLHEDSKRSLGDMLVLIDQHAADERIQVESLFQDLCMPVDSEGYRSRLGHCAKVASSLLDKPVQFVVSRQELEHFDTFAQNFAHWGILYDILASGTPSDRADTTLKAQNILTVTSLPPSISERCKSDAGLLISLLRSTVWTYANGTNRAAKIPISSEKAPGWAQRLASCPEGLVDIVNSRACRSAIMFNDELSLDQCKRLVTRLAACVFPFMCAHGRPSMVPLVALGRRHDNSEPSKPDRCGKAEDFVQAWKQWKR